MQPLVLLVLARWPLLNDGLPINGTQFDKSLIRMAWNQDFMFPEAPFTFVVNLIILWGLGSHG